MKKIMEFLNKHFSTDEKVSYSKELREIYFNKKVIVREARGYKEIDDGFFIRVDLGNRFFTKSGKEVSYNKFLFGYEVFWSRKCVKYYNLAGMVCDENFISLLRKYNSMECLKKVFQDGYYIYRVEGSNLLLNNSLEVVLSANARLVRNEDIFTYKSEKEGLFFEAFSLSKNKYVQTINLNDLHCDCDCLIPLFEKIKKDASVFVTFQAISERSVKGYNLYKWSLDSYYEIYDEKLNFIDGIKSGYMEISPRGYLKSQNGENVFLSFDKKIILKKRWNIKVFKGVLVILQNQKGQFFHEIYSIKDGGYIGRILATFIEGKEKTIQNVKSVDIESTELGVSFVLDGGRLFHYNSYGDRY